MKTGRRRDRMPGFACHTRPWCFVITDYIDGVDIGSHVGKGFKRRKAAARIGRDIYKWGQENFVLQPGETSKATTRRYNKNAEREV